MKAIRFRSIRSRVSFWFFTLVVITLLATIFVAYSQRAEGIKMRAVEKLTVIRNLKVEQLENWIKEREGDLKAVSEDMEIKLLEVAFKKEKRTEQEISAIDNAERILNRHLNNFLDYSELFIINSVTGIVEISTDKSREGDNKLEDDFFNKPLESREFFISDIYYSPVLNQPALTLSIPIFCITHKEKDVTGILVARVDLQNSFYPYLQDVTGMGDTGETLIVNKDVIALNELRWQEDAPLKLKINAQPALMASQGYTGIHESTDYRGVKVLAAYTYIPETGWGFVAKQDFSEIYAPIRAMLNNFILLFAVITIILFFVSQLLSNSLTKPLTEMALVSQKVQSGNLKVRNKIYTKDEIGYLADSYNKMADSMESKIKSERGRSEISTIMIPLQNMKDINQDLFNKLMKITDSDMGALYNLNEEKSKFEHLISVGIDAALVKSFDVHYREGDFGKAIIEKKITHLKDIPPDTIFKFKTIAGTAIPKEIITIPIVVENQVSAIISFASLKKYSLESLEILDNSSFTLNMLFSNFLSNEKRARLTEEIREKNVNLQSQADELQSQSVELQSQTDELSEQNIELEMQKKQVEEADRLKSEFLSNMSHELRTPLNSIMALSHVLNMQTKNKISSEESNYLEIIERNGKNLLALINDILDLSKIEAGKLDINLHNFSLKPIFENIRDSLLPIAKEKEIEVNLNIPENLPKIQSDSEKIHQILQNIIGNAVKFTEKGMVSINAVANESLVVIKIVDTGIGISKENLPHIFEEFRQVDGSTSRRFEGTGLGLAIANKLAEKLGIEISTKSELGKGSIFTLYLPIKWKGSADGGETAVLSESWKPDEEKRTILVVDNELETVERISDYLKKVGYNTIGASNGKTALEMAQKYHPFAITLDIIMPEMDGWEVLQQLKENPETSGIPVIIVSISESKEIGFALGAIGYITKPLEKDFLLSEIRKIRKKKIYSIMVVDDNEIDRNQIARIVEEEAIETIRVGSGKECLTQLSKRIPDLLILDIMMPEMDGFEILRRIKSKPETKDLGVIIVTAKDLSKDEKNQLKGMVISVLDKSNESLHTINKEIERILDKISEKRIAESEKIKKASTILMVEDNKETIIQVKIILEKEGYIVDVAEGGKAALEYVEHTIPDGIILDLMMPEIDGFEVLKTIRSNFSTAKIPVLILTAKDLSREDFKKLGANNIQQLLFKGAINKDELIFKTKLMLGNKTDDLKKAKYVVNKEIKIDKKAVLPQLKVFPKREGLSTILIAEDNPDNMITAEAILKDKYNLIEAIDGEAALNKAKTDLPDLILMDISLPKMDGLTVVKFLKDEKTTKNIPIIAISAKAMKGDKEETIAAGCSDYISKPIDPEKMLRKIDKWIRKKKI